MKYVRIMVILLFLASIGLTTIEYYQTNKNRDVNPPVINVDNALLPLSIEYTEEDLMNGVTATDQQDGDLTDQIIVGELSQFSNPGVSSVTYTVFDTYGNSCTVKRTVQFTDYTSPTIDVDSPLVILRGGAFNIRTYLKATDVLDGDITAQIQQLHSTLDNETPGVYEVEVEVTNNLGDSVRMKLPVHVLEEGRKALKNNLPMVRIKVGESFSVQQCKNTICEGEDLSAVSVESNVQPNTPGVYEIHCYTSTADTWTIVVVE